MSDTVFALSSGAPPAGIAVLRISGPSAGDALRRLAGDLPSPRVATLRTLRDEAGDVLDVALTVWFPGPASATGEDVAELHCHGGRAVVAALEAALGRMPRLRRAQPGEFTRRAFTNGRIDLIEAEGLADLLAAETQAQRRSALLMAGGDTSRRIEAWRDRLLAISAQVEAVLDFDDEGDVAVLQDPAIATAALDLADELADWLSRPRAERLREGVRVVVAGPPNAGKSTLFNALLNQDAAIVAPTAGTTRDVLERDIALGGIGFTLIDTAGLREVSDDPIEVVGIGRARGAIATADIVLWLGEGDREGAWTIAAQIDRGGQGRIGSPRHRVSARTGDGMEALIDDLVATAARIMPQTGEVAVSRKQALLLAEARTSLVAAGSQTDMLLLAEDLRTARLALDRLIGRASTEDVLDALFGRFCIGK